LVSIRMARLGGTLHTGGVRCAGGSKRDSYAGITFALFRPSEHLTALRLGGCAE